MVYRSAWLKVITRRLLRALLNNQPMGFWWPAVIVNDAKRRGIRVAANPS